MAAIRRGVAYPLRVVNGTLAISADYKLYAEAILSVLQTQPWERVMQRYGTPDMTFWAQRSADVLAEIIHQSLEQFVPEIDIEVVGTPSESGLTEITIRWAIDNIPQPPLNLSVNS
jgi:hypothetical protein